MSLTVRQRATLRAAMDRIVPADAPSSAEAWPSASQAGVEGYFSKQFDSDLKPLLALYAAALDAIDAEARAVYSSGFAELLEEQQDELLRKIERGETDALWPEPSNVFFQRLVNHVMEGYYGDSGNGGNRDQVSWKMIGFEGRRS